MSRKTKSETLEARLEKIYDKPAAEVIQDAYEWAGSLTGAAKALACNPNTLYALSVRLGLKVKNTLVKRW